MSFLKRRLDVTITLDKGEFGDGKGNTVTLKGHRVGAYIAQAGGDAQGVLQCQIYGLPLDMLNKLTAIGPVALENRNNKILIAAGTEDKDGNVSMSTVFQGTINEAWADLSRQPDVALNILAYSATDIALKPVNAVSYKGSVDVAKEMKYLAEQAGLAFENNGVNVTLSNVYLPGTRWEQIKKLAHAANINQTVHNNTLAIWPMHGSRAGAIPIISPSTGMVGYPTFSSNGVVLNCIYNKDVRLGGHVEVQSSFSVASGIWTVMQVIHSLESENTNGGGAWITTLICSRVSENG